jgi:hypothetical protein
MDFCRDWPACPSRSVGVGREDLLGAQRALRGGSNLTPRAASLSISATEPRRSAEVVVQVIGDQKEHVEPRALLWL